MIDRDTCVAHSVKCIPSAQVLGSSATSVSLLSRDPASPFPLPFLLGCVLSLSLSPKQENKIFFKKRK